ncbi:hypothetical protein ABFS83_12G011700 [Erythranthe nasuta]
MSWECGARVLPLFYFLSSFLRFRKSFVWPRLFNFFSLFFLLRFSFLPYRRCSFLQIFYPTIIGLLLGLCRTSFLLPLLRFQPAASCSYHCNSFWISVARFMVLSLRQRRQLRPSFSDQITGLLDTVVDATAR